MGGKFVNGIVVSASNKSENAIVVRRVENGFVARIEGTRHHIEDGIHLGEFVFQTIDGLCEFFRLRDGKRGEQLSEDGAKKDLTEKEER